MNVVTANTFLVSNHWTHNEKLKDFQLNKIFKWFYTAVLLFLRSFFGEFFG